MKRLEKASFYKVYFAKQFAKLTEKLHNNCIILCDNEITVTHWGNPVSGELTGKSLSLVRRKRKTISR